MKEKERLPHQRKRPKQRKKSNGIKGKYTFLLVCTSIGKEINIYDERENDMLYLGHLDCIFLLCFTLALCWYLNGSFETAPTEEQQEKAQMGALLSMAVAGIPCAACVSIRLKLKKKQNKNRNVAEDDSNRNQRS